MRRAILQRIEQLRTLTHRQSQRLHSQLRSRLETDRKALVYLGREDRISTRLGQQLQNPEPIPCMLLHEAHVTPIFQRDCKDFSLSSALEK